MTSENFRTTHYTDDVPSEHFGTTHEVYNVNNTAMDDVGDESGSLGFTTTVNQAEIDPPNLMNPNPFPGLDGGHTAELVPNTWGAIRFANESTSFGSGSLQSLANGSDYLPTGLDPLASATMTPVLPIGDLGVNLIGNAAIDNAWAGFDVNAMFQPFDFGQPLTFESNSPVAPIDIHGVPPNSPNVCLCGKPFSRPDALRRHIRTVHRTPTQASPAASGTSGPAGLFPCVYCDKHRDDNSFVRRDNLRQHLKVYHRMNKEGIDGYFRTYHWSFKTDHAG